VSQLPYLDKSTWPSNKEGKEVTVNPSYHTQLQEHLVNELIEALEKKDQSSIIEALYALAETLREEEENAE
jgi:hypothetical protein